ncbi:MAG TPA: hypothetical protein VLG50_05115 [Candidatus Saccharimonadales bacterium]|nr:hypothetical protein [Candidatus Saccharimonadales bacterium]
MYQTIPELIKQLNRYDGYQTITKTNYSSRVGKKEDLVKLINKLKNTPLEFEELLPELQSSILSQNIEMLKQSQRLSKNVSKHTQQAYYQHLCQLPITHHEINQYGTLYKPSQLFLFVIIPLKLFNIFAVNQYSYFLTNNLFEYKGITIQKVKQNNGLITYRLDNFGNGNEILDIDRQIETVKIDLLTLYHIYKLRLQCEKIHPHFAKQKVLQELNDYKKQVNINNYISLFKYWLYLYYNARQFPIFPKQENFLDYKVTVDDNGDIVIVDHPTLTPDILMEQLQQSCEHWYDELTYWIDKLL